VSIVALALLALPSLDLAQLPRFKGWKVGAVTSYDRTEGNDDGFSGKYSFVRKEGDALVLADLKGPGCVTRFHTPTPTDAPLEFYFDGEATPRVSLPYRKLFSGEVAPFVRPLVDGVGGGFYSYVRMPYAKSCKIVLRGPAQFYDINYATYPVGTPVETFNPKVPLALPAVSHRAAGSFDRTLGPGKTVTLYETKAAGRIESLRLGPASAFAGKDRDILLRVTWDGAKAPAILMPVGDFFGYAWGKPTMASAYVGARDDVAYCELPMPFAKGAKVELTSLRDRPLSVRGEIAVSGEGRRTDEGEFYALWHRENPTTKGRPFTWVDLKGRGHLVGLSLQAQGLETGNTFFFEGDDVTTTDGETVVHGTGSEDFFNGGWYDLPGRWDHAFSRPFSGSLGYEKHLGRTGGYRFLIGDAYPFAHSLVQTIEHGPERNEHPTDYVGVAYLYLDRPPTPPTVPTLAERRVVDPKRIAFAAHWATPIESFSLDGATLARGGDPRTLTLRSGVGGFVTLRLDLPAAGRYRVFINARKSPEAPSIRAEVGEAPIGSAVDLYAEKATTTNGLAMGEIDAVEGPNRLTFRIVGKRTDVARLDLMDVVLERIESL